LAAAIIGFVVVVGMAVAMVLIARIMPPGRSRELIGFIPNCVVLLSRLRHDRRLPWRARLALGAAFAYVVSPVQLLPNFVPVIGQADDVFVVTVALRYACRRLPRADVESAWPGDRAYLDRLLGTARAVEPATTSDHPAPSSVTPAPPAPQAPSNLSAQPPVPPRAWREPWHAPDIRCDADPPAPSKW
jgi:uncharacterized membrane protein YkvA (DUF1232 family)